jgi:hypothetical protein
MMLWPFQNYALRRHRHRHRHRVRAVLSAAAATSELASYDEDMIFSLPVGLRTSCCTINVRVMNTLDTHMSIVTIV